MRRTAFSLAEVLVVVGILALLMAIAASGLRAARAQGRLVRCAANLRELGSGLNQYADESSDVLPLNFGETWTTAWAGTQALEIVVGETDTWVAAVQHQLGRDSAPWLAPLRCPSAATCPVQPAAVADVNSRPGAGWILNSYCRGRQRTSIRSPGDGVLLMESALWTSFSEDSGSLEFPRRPECYPHPSVAALPVTERWKWSYRGHKRNVLWCDSHVAASPAARWPDGDGTFDPARRRHMRFGLPGLHPLDP